MTDPTIQHAQMILGLCIAFSMLGTLLFSVAGRWIGGAWITAIATLVACLLAYQPLIGASLFDGFATDLLRRILIGMVPFTIIALLIGPKKIPGLVRLLFSLIAPSALLYWVFCHFDVTVPRPMLFTHEVLPVAAAIFVTWLFIEPLAYRSPGAAAPIAIGAITAGLAFLLILSTENQAGLMAPIIPATAGGAVLAAIVAAMIKKPIQFARGPVLVWIMLIAALFAFMWFDTEKLPVPYLYWIASVPLLAWVPEIGPLHRLRPWKRESLRLVLVLIPVIIAAVLAFKQHKQEATESGDEYGLVYPAAPTRPSQMPIPNTISPPTIT